MNIFFLDVDPKKSAQYHCDKHVVKMILEIVQLLYTAHHILGSKLPKDAYKPVSVSHPLAIWIKFQPSFPKYGNNPGTTCYAYRMYG